MVFDRLRTIIAAQFALGEEAITMETSFMDDLGVDSLDVAELTMAIEEEFDIQEMEEEELPTLETVGDVFRYISYRVD